MNVYGSRGGAAGRWREVRRRRSSLVNYREPGFYSPSFFPVFVSHSTGERVLMVQQPSAYGARGFFASFHLSFKTRSKIALSKRNIIFDITYYQNMPHSLEIFTRRTRRIDVACYCVLGHFRWFILDDFVFTARTASAYVLVVWLRIARVTRDDGDDVLVFGVCNEAYTIIRVKYWTL